MKHVSFTKMEDGSREDFVFLEREERRAASTVSARLMDALKALHDVPSAYQISKADHCIQAASRAERDGADEDWIATALLHDVGDLFAPYNHDEVAAAILRPYVREQCSWVVANHGLFQRYYYAHHFGGDREVRRRFENHPYYEDCIDFCERWDQRSYDPSYPSLALNHFAPLVERVFAREPYQAHVIAAGERRPLKRTK